MTSNVQCIHFFLLENILSFLLFWICTLPLFWRSEVHLRPSYEKMMCLCVYIYTHIHIYSACDRYMLAPENIHRHTNYNFKEVADCGGVFIYQRGSIWYCDTRSCVMMRSHMINRISQLGFKYSFWLKS